MDNKKLVIKVLKESGVPMKTAEIAGKTGLNSKEAGKIIKVLKASGEIFSPKRCYYQIKE